MHMLINVCIIIITNGDSCKMSILLSIYEFTVLNLLIRNLYLDCDHQTLSRGILNEVRLIDKACALLSVQCRLSKRSERTYLIKKCLYYVRLICPATEQNHSY